MEKINGLYNDLNELAKDQDDKLMRLDNNIDDAIENTKSANKQLRKSKPKSIVNIRLVITVLILTAVVFYFLSHYFFSPFPSTRRRG
jgi:t-SNARE complex subunit (syntaxin)